LRVPRTLVGLAAGLALGVAGALIQAVTRNPLADPGILGVTAGSAFAVAVATGVLGVTAVSGYLWFAFAGALAAAVVVYVVGSAGRGGGDPVRLTLAGVAL
ncbi:Fe(3+)-siderophore ABC transporter permease, partial [Clavibacter michiganensis subsp. insidiosus]